MDRLFDAAMGVTMFLTAVALLGITVLLFHSLLTGGLCA